MMQHWLPTVADIRQPATQAQHRRVAAEFCIRRAADGLPDRSRTRHELGRTISVDEDLRLFSGAFDDEI